MTPDVRTLLEEARGYLVGVGELDEGDPVPREEVAAQLEAVGFGGGRDEPPADWFVDQALDEGDLVAVDGGLEPSGCDETDETPETPARDPRGTEKTDDDPQGETGKTAEDLSKYRRIYEDAADRAGREPWEPVEEAALREALDAVGFADLLDNGTLFDVRPWRFVDVSDEGEEPRRRWYYPSGEEPRPD